MSLIRFLINNLYITLVLLVFYLAVDLISESNLLPRTYTAFGFIIMYFAVLPVHGLIVYGGKKK